jgi:hypothetical protein
MFCTNCGANIKDGSKFCNKCGAAADPVGEGLAPSAGAAPKRPHKRLFITLAVVMPLIIALAVIAGYFLLRQDGGADVSQVQGNAEDEVIVAEEVEETEEEEADIEELPAEVENKINLEAYRAYYEVLKWAIDRYGVEDVSEEYDMHRFHRIGLHYAELIDFDNNGTPELLFVNVVPGAWADVYIYGYQERLEQLFSSVFSYSSTGPNHYGISFATDGTQYLTEWFRREYGWYNLYFTLVDGEFTKILEVSCDGSWVGPDDKYYINGEFACEYAYEDLVDSYEEVIQFREQFFAETITARLGAIETANESPYGDWLSPYDSWLDQSTTIYELLTILETELSETFAQEDTTGLRPDIAVPFWDEEGEFAAGDGTEESPYIIINSRQLSNVRNHLGSHFRLKRNVGIDTYIEEFAPIGAGEFNGVWSAEQGFYGVFDGGNCTISISLNSSALSSGLFASVGKSGAIKNLHFSGSAQTTGSDVNNTIGAIVGYNSGTVENCSFSSGYGGVTGSGKYATVGGIVGTNEGVVRDCTSSGIITSTGEYAKAGGIVGLNLPDGQIIDCRSEATVASDYRAGEIVGLNEGEVR